MGQSVFLVAESLHNDTGPTQVLLCAKFPDANSHEQMCSSVILQVAESGQRLWLQYSSVSWISLGKTGWMRRQPIRKRVWDFCFLWILVNRPFRPNRYQAPHRNFPEKYCWRGQISLSSSSNKRPRCLTMPLDLYCLSETCSDLRTVALGVCSSASIRISFDSLTFMYGKYSFSVITPVFRISLYKATLRTVPSVPKD